ncbi:hypothetical protein GCM10007049_06160 [Echinicola pacifica]|uniref:PKD domain-containing protein n=1 Tax=Echinicola pacifica TaxID=346377 RepID=A0A918UKJ9_9BACT|nr:PKD domain-containing protein [Echinicola pacifica]GGZ16557.1 hypothetical protein GCM10007049_06160 [Echinicola pacifica]
MKAFVQINSWNTLEVIALPLHSGIVVLLGILLMSFSNPDVEYKVFQFPQDRIPRIDGEFEDWDMVPDSYNIGLDQLLQTEGEPLETLDSADYDITVKVAWVKDLNRLYFYLEAYDDFWSFEDKALSQDIFELVVDADLSGGPFIKRHNGNTTKFPQEALHFNGHGAHAQNYHVFTPVKNKDAVMIWGNTPWIKDFPYFNVAYDYDFVHGESGRLQMEFYITPFDYAAVEGIESSKISELKENQAIGLSWCVIDYDTNHGKFEGFMNLAHDTRMIYDASYLNVFRLMPLEEEYQKALEANWSFVELDRQKRWIQFMDKSIGQVTAWHWDFGDGQISTEQNPSHTYSKAGEWTVVLTATGAAGQSVRSKVWDVVTE